jgi:hypothetical protein
VIVMSEIVRRGVLAASVLLVFMLAPALAQQSRQVVALLVGTVDLYDNPTAAPARRVSRNEIQTPLDVLAERPEGFVQVKLRDGRSVWLDSSQVKLNGKTIRCTGTVARNMPPLGTMGSGDSCQR